MATNTYHFVTTWRVESTLAEVMTILADGPGLVRWWPSVYLDVQELKPGDRDGLGKTVSLYTKGWLPYTLRWQFEFIEVRPPIGFTLKAWGDLEGIGIWTFEQEEGVGDPQKPGWVRINYDWNITAEKPILKYLSFVMKPLFSANHHWAMARGEESLKLELARRQARSQAEQNLIPEPPGPTFGFLLPKNGKASTEPLASR